MARYFNLHLTSRQTNHFIVRYFHENKQGIAILALTDSNIEQIKSIYLLFKHSQGIVNSVNSIKSVLQKEKRVFPYPQGTDPKELIDSKVFSKEYRTNKAFWKVEPFKWNNPESTYIIEEVFLISELYTFHFEVHFYPERGISNTLMLIERIPYSQIGL